MKVFVVEVRSFRHGSIDATVSCIVSSYENARLHMKKNIHSMNPNHWWTVYSQLVDGGSVCEEMMHFNYLGEPKASQKLAR